MRIFPTHTALQSISDACVTVMKFKFNEYQLTSSMQYKNINKYTLHKDNVANIFVVMMDTTKSVMMHILMVVFTITLLISTQTFINRKHSHIYALFYHLFYSNFILILMFYFKVYERKYLSFCDFYIFKN